MGWIFEKKFTRLEKTGKDALEMEKEENKKIEESQTRKQIVETESLR